MSRGVRALCSFIIVVFVVAALALYISKSYYPQHPISSLSKAELLSVLQKSNNGEFIQVTEHEAVEWYAYQGNQKEAGQKLILAMEQRQWLFKEQLGSGYFFEDQNHNRAIVSSQMWTSKYVLFKVPVSNPQD